MNAVMKCMVCRAMHGYSATTGHLFFALNLVLKCIVHHSKVCGATLHTGIHLPRLVNFVLQFVFLQSPHSTIFNSAYGSSFIIHGQP